MFSRAGLELGRAARILAALMTCGHKFSSSCAACLTIFIPSSLFDMLQAKSATCGNIKFFKKFIVIEVEV
jgi:hypothetical protein